MVRYMLVDKCTDHTSIQLKRKTVCTIQLPSYMSHFNYLIAMTFDQLHSMEMTLIPGLTKITRCLDCTLFLFVCRFNRVPNNTQNSGHNVSKNQNNKLLAEGHEATILNIAITLVLAYLKL